MSSAVTKSHYTDHRSVIAGGDGSGTHSLEGNEALTRGIIRYATLDEFKQNPNFAHEEERAFRRSRAGREHVQQLAL